MLQRQDTAAPSNVCTLSYQPGILLWLSEVSAIDYALSLTWQALQVAVRSGSYCDWVPLRPRCPTSRCGLPERGFLSLDYSRG